MASWGCVSLWFWAKIFWKVWLSYLHILDNLLQEEKGFLHYINCSVNISHCKPNRHRQSIYTHWYITVLSHSVFKTRTLEISHLVFHPLQPVLERHLQDLINIIVYFMIFFAAKFAFINANYLNPIFDMDWTCR